MVTILINCEIFVLYAITLTWEKIYIYWPCLMMIVMYISLLHIKVIPHDLKIYACQIFIFLRTIGQYSIKISTRGTGCILCLPVPSWGSFLGSSPYHCLWQGDNKRWKRLSPPHWGIHCAKVRPLCVYVDNCTMGIKLSCNWTCSWQCYCQCDYYESLQLNDRQCNWDCRSACQPGRWCSCKNWFSL